MRNNSIIEHHCSSKGGIVEERFYKKLHSTANLIFFLSLFVYLLKNCSSQFFSNWKSAEPVFCRAELSCLPYKNQNKSLTHSFGERKTNHVFNIVTFNFSTNIFGFGSVCTRQGTAHGHYWIREFEARENFVLFINLSLPSTIYSQKPQIFQHLAYWMFSHFYNLMFFSNSNKQM